MATESKILIVDDEEPIRNVLETILTREGYEVCSAESAERALDILKRETFLVIFLDINLPNMNGIELCKKIRTKNPVAVIYAFTGYATIFDVFDCRQAGFDDFFSKPFSRETVLKATQDAFDRVKRWNL